MYSSSRENCLRLSTLIILRVLFTTRFYFKSILLKPNFSFLNCKLVVFQPHSERKEFLILSDPFSSFSRSHKAVFRILTTFVTIQCPPVKKPFRMKISILFYTISNLRTTLKTTNFYFYTPPNRGLLPG